MNIYVTIYDVLTVMIRYFNLLLEHLLGFHGKTNFVKNQQSRSTTMLNIAATTILSKNLEQQNLMLFRLVLI